MSLNVIDLIKGQLGPALVSQAASQYGESESGISKAISGLLPAVVGGLANNSSNSTVLDAITGASSSGLLGNLLGGSSNNSLISSVLSAIFGDKVGGLVNAVSNFAGIGSSSTNSLLNLVTGAALGSVGKYAADNNLDRSGLTSLLNDQKGIVSSLLPAGLSLASLGLGNWFGGDKTVNVDTDKVRVSSYDEPKVEVNRGGATHVNVDRNDNNDGGSIWKWLLPLLLLLLAGWFLWKQCGNKETTAVTDTTDSTAVVSDDSAAVTRTTTDIDLNGTKLRGYANGMEQQMINFLKGDGYKNAADDAALKDTWYNFDNVNFVFGKSDQITPESVGQLENLAAILKAYPDSKIKIGGYTDKKGDDKANLDLSQKRADYIKKRLTDLGVGAQVIGAEGYGEKFATVAETASDKEREADRKMSVRFAK
ncbi:OmpA family protein [Chryseobacterium taklimakanense]|uniref:OmpA family protein n=1 Tax=Chryseobacterium taklimakanense TaxID=536441 RepID=UPI001EF64363|nr:OmpA family protein [Chryseobacterium taklimakanense]MCG7280702.1 OmpA family protein [Chryseobacterium taklimakanense]